MVLLAARGVHDVGQVAANYLGRALSRSRNRAHLHEITQSVSCLTQCGGAGRLKAVSQSDRNFAVGAYVHDTLATPDPLPAAVAIAAEPVATQDLATEMTSWLQAGAVEVALQAARAEREPGPAIHAMRRQIRGLRALLRLMRGAWPGDLPRQADQALGAARRALAHARDADVLPAAVDRLPEKTLRTMVGIREHLALKREIVLSDPLWAEVALAVAERTHAVVSALVAQLGQVDAAEGRRGLRRMLRRLEKCQERCEKLPNYRRVHTLRKQAKYVADALGWLACPVSAERTTLDKAIGQLGRATDAVVLRTWLRKTGAARRLGVRRSHVRATERLMGENILRAQANFAKLATWLGDTARHGLEGSSARRGSTPRTLTNSAANEGA